MKITRDNYEAAFRTMSDLAKGRNRVLVGDTEILRTVMRSILKSIKASLPENAVAKDWRNATATRGPTARAIRESIAVGASTEKVSVKENEVREVLLYLRGLVKLEAAAEPAECGSMATS